MIIFPIQPIKAYLIPPASEFCSKILNVTIENENLSSITEPMEEENEEKMNVDPVESESDDENLSKSRETEKLKIKSAKFKEENWEGLWKSVQFES